MLQKSSIHFGKKLHHVFITSRDENMNLLIINVISFNDQKILVIVRAAVAHGNKVHLNDFS